MTRCRSCDGIITKNEEICYHCGDSVSGRSKSARTLLFLVVGAGLIASLGFAAYLFRSGVTP
jgi:hypothetical protein